MLFSNYFWNFNSLCKINNGKDANKRSQFSATMIMFLLVWALAHPTIVRCKINCQLSADPLLIVLIEELQCMWTNRCKREVGSAAKVSSSSCFWYKCEVSCWWLRKVEREVVENGSFCCVVFLTCLIKENFEAFSEDGNLIGGNTGGKITLKLSSVYCSELLQSSAYFSVKTWLLILTSIWLNFCIQLSKVPPRISDCVYIKEFTMDDNNETFNFR